MKEQFQLAHSWIKTLIVGCSMVYQQGYTQPFQIFDQLPSAWHSLGHANPSPIQSTSQKVQPLLAIAGNWENPLGMSGVHRTTTGFCVSHFSAALRTQWHHEQWLDQWSEDVIQADIGYGWKDWKMRMGGAIHHNQSIAFEAPWKGAHPSLELEWGSVHAFLAAKVTTSGQGDTLGFSFGGYGLPCLTATCREVRSKSYASASGWRWKGGMQAHATVVDRERWRIARSLWELEYSWKGGFALGFEARLAHGKNQEAMSWSTTLVLPWRAFRFRTKAISLAGLGTTFGSGLYWSNQGLVISE